MTPSKMAPSKPRRRSLLTALSAALVSGLILTGCATASPESGPSSSSQTSSGQTSSGQTSESGFLAAHDLAGLDATQVIEKLDTMLIANRLPI